MDVHPVRVTFRMTYCELLLGCIDSSCFSLGEANADSVVISIAAIPCPLDELLSLSNDARAFPSCGHAKYEFNPSGLPTWESVGKVVVDVIVYTAKVVLKPFPGLFECGKVAVRTGVLVCRIQVELEVLDYICVLASLLAKKTPGLDFSRILFILKSSRDLVCEFANHFTRPMLKSLWLCPIRAHGVGDTWRSQSDSEDRERDCL